MNKTLWLGPVSVLAFVVLLTVMYGWTGTNGPLPGEAPERPEMNPAAQISAAPFSPAAAQPWLPQDQLATGAGHQPSFPAGIGQGAQGQIQLINKPAFSAGIGNGANGQMQLIAQAQPGKARPYLGLNVGELPEAVSRQLNLPPETGMYVKNVLAGSPAEIAGLKTGDVILKLDHQKLTAHEQIGLILQTKKVGDAVKLHVRRGKRKQTFHVKLAAAPNGLKAVAATVRQPNWMGADIQDIDAIMKMQFNLPDTRGVIVSHVQPDSPAATAGLTAGDVIRRFNGKRIGDVKQLQRSILDAQPGAQVQMALLRGRQLITLPVVLGQHTPGKQPIPFIGPADMAVEGTWIGMDVSELGANDATALGLPAGTQGVLVNDVESPPATMVGFQTGDLIIAVNGHPTPDMKQFVAATQKQNSAVVDVVRGNKHLFISVPPPGYTQQGAKINTPLNDKLKQVGLTQPMAGRIGVLTALPDINGPVASDAGSSLYLILIDMNTNEYAVVGIDAKHPLTQTLVRHGVRALIGGNVGPATVSRLQHSGIMVYSGVVGPAQAVIGLYQSGQLSPMPGQA